MDTQATLKQPTRCRMCARRRRRRRRSATGAASARRSASSACESGRRKPWNAQRVCKRGTASKPRPAWCKRTARWRPSTRTSRAPTRRKTKWSTLTIGGLAACEQHLSASRSHPRSHRQRASEGALGADTIEAHRAPANGSAPRYRPTFGGALPLRG